MHGRSLKSQNKVNCSVLWPVFQSPQDDCALHDD